MLENLLYTQYICVCNVGLTFEMLKLSSLTPYMGENEVVSTKIKREVYYKLSEKQPKYPNYLKGLFLIK